MVNSELISHVERLFAPVSVIKSFRPSGQRSVFVIQRAEQKKEVLKISKDGAPRIQREIEILDNVSIPGIPRIIDSGRLVIHGQTFFYTLEEYIEGESLYDRLALGSPLPMRHVLSLFEDMLCIIVGLEQAHVVHRDIKPANIISAIDGSFHLIDLGIARQWDMVALTKTDASSCPHTIGYGAPELYHYDPSLIDSRTDLFSLGVVIYEACFCKHPFLGEDKDWNTVCPRIDRSDYEKRELSWDKSGLLMQFVDILIKPQPNMRPPNAKVGLKMFKRIKGMIE